MGRERLWMGIKSEVEFQDVDKWRAAKSAHERTFGFIDGFQDDGGIHATGFGDAVGLVSSGRLGDVGVQSGTGCSDKVGGDGVFC